MPEVMMATTPTAPRSKMPLRAEVVGGVLMKALEQ
jgi:hypothetical protein